MQQSLTMAPLIVTALQPEPTSTIQVEKQTPPPTQITDDKKALTKSPIKGDELTNTDTASVATSSQIPVITTSENKKKPYGGRPLRFQCPNCERRFHAPSHLKRHMLCHTSERPFQCHICNKGFLQAWHLGRHMTTHTGNKPFHCPECPKTFGSRFEMKTHCNYIHRGIKEHECPICKKMFTLRSNLKVHMRKHTGEKPYECHVCSKKFGQRGHLQYHLRKHEGASESPVNKKDVIEEQDEIIDVENDNDSQTTSYDSGIESVSSETSRQSYQKLSRESSTESAAHSPQPTRIVSPVFRERKSSSDIPLSGRMFDHTNPQELKPFVCVSCNCGFGEISSLRAHVRHSHQRKGIEGSHFSCAHCFESFTKIDTLKTHYEEMHKPHNYIKSTSVISPPLSPASPVTTYHPQHPQHPQQQQHTRKVGEKYSYTQYTDAEYEPSLKRSQSQILYEERRTGSPGGHSTSSDTTHDRLPYYRGVFYSAEPAAQCPSDCECTVKPLVPVAPPPTEKEGDFVQSRYLRYLEQYQKLLESHVQLMEAMQVCRK